MDAKVKKYRPQASGNIMYHLRNLRLVPWCADFPVMLLEVSKHLQENTDESTRKATPIFNYPDPSFTGHPHTLQEIVNGLKTTKLSANNRHLARLLHIKDFTDPDDQVFPFLIIPNSDFVVSQFY